MNPQDFVNALNDALGPRLKSVVLYGSAAAGDFVPGMSGYDLLIVLDPLGTKELNEMASAIELWTKAGNSTPELLTPDELRHSTDVFPIEFSDMQQARKLLFGEDPLVHIQPDMQHYRMQLERELKIKLFLLRRKYVAAAGEPEPMEQLLLASVSTFLVLLRATLRLYNVEAPAEKAKAVELLGERLKLDLSPIARVAEGKTSGLPEEAEKLEQLFGQYLTAIQQVVEAVDRYLHPASE